jgi:hypothetical protein
MLTRNAFAPLRTTDMDTQITGAGNTLPEQEASRDSDRPSSKVMISTTNLIRIQSDLKERVKGEHDFRNKRNGTRIIIKETADYSAIKCHLEKNNLHYFTFSPNFEKPINAVIRYLPQTRQRKIFQQP